MYIGLCKSNMLVCSRDEFLSDSPRHPGSLFNSQIHLPCLPLHGHVQDVQSKVARQSHPAYLPTLQALLYHCAGARHRECLQQRVPRIVTFLLQYRWCFFRIPRIHTEAPCTHMKGHTSCCNLREHAVDGSIIIRWDWHFDLPFFVSLSSTEKWIAIHMGSSRRIGPRRWFSQHQETLGSMRRT